MLGEQAFCADGLVCWGKVLIGQDCHRAQLPEGKCDSVAGPT